MVHKNQKSNLEFDSLNILRSLSFFEKSVR